MQDLLCKLVNVAKSEELNLYGIAVADRSEMAYMPVCSANPCQNSYSIAKLFCVTAVGMLVDEGMLSVDTSIGEIFKEEFAAYGISATKWAGVRVHDVLRHEIGFVKGFLDIDIEDINQYESDDWLYLVLAHPLRYAPGMVRVYSDAAYYLVSRIVTKISGERLDDFLMKRLFSRINCREVAFSKCPKGFSVGATGLYIRTTDMIKLGCIYLCGGCYRGESILSEKWVDTVLKNGYEFRPAGSGFAKGGMNGQYLYINKEKDIAVAWHAFDPMGKTKCLGQLL